ncbi:MAG TPA: Spy/CpxP family protein refolding chaperone [Gemmatimonadaceae bacterium]
MRRSFHLLAILTMTAASGTVAQNPPRQGMPPMPPMARMRGAQGQMAGEGSAQMMLARSAQLELTDAQVVKLAGIARRAEARHKTMRSAMDSARAKFAQPGDSAARRQFRQRMMDGMTKERDQSRVDLRDAIAVLTPDQQAKAWEMNSARRAMRVAMRGGARGGMRGPRPFGPRGMPGMGRGGAMGPGQMGRGAMPAPPDGMRPRRARPPMDESPSDRIPD